MNLEIPPKKLIIFTLSTIQLFYTLQSITHLFLSKIKKNSIQFFGGKSVHGDFFLFLAPLGKTIFTISRQVDLYFHEKIKNFFLSLSSDKW